jgi:glutamine amidotransferase
VQNIVIIDPPIANVSNVQKAVGGIVSSKLEDIKKADKIIFPGVGSFDAAMKELSGIKSYVLEHIDKGKPFLGICLGFQILFSSSEEGKEEGLSVIKEKIERFENIKTPHMGWNKVFVERDNRLFKGIEDESYFYFVHSYFLNKSNYAISKTNYGEYDFVSAVQKDNVFGVQFHPEKSSKNGLKLLDNFRRL